MTATLDALCGVIDALSARGLDADEIAIAGDVITVRGLRRVPPPRDAEPSAEDTGRDILRVLA